MFSVFASLIYVLLTKFYDLKLIEKIFFFLQKFITVINALS